MPKFRKKLLDLLCGNLAEATVSPKEWSEIIGTARAANLLGSLGEKLGRDKKRTGCNADRHLEGARQLSERQRRSVRWEAQCIHNALSKLATPVVMLKGAAYTLGDHRNAYGRLFGDVDILVAPEALDAVELQLMVNGWTSVTTTAYDQRYYRNWMHELPPMLHVRRGSILDVHHTILPPTARHKPNARRIIERATSLPDMPSLFIPCPEDLIIHSITHLVHEGELHNGLRDLYDIHVMIDTHSMTDGFWARLADYTLEHGLAAPVSLGIYLVHRYFNTVIPNTFYSALAEMPSSRYRNSLETIYELALRPCPNRRVSWTTELANFALYIRAHWIRMPPTLLIKHLSRKAALRFSEKRSN